MSDLFVKIKGSSFWASVLCIVFGLMFCLWPGAILLILCRLVGAALLVAGVVLLIMSLRTSEAPMRLIRLIPGLVCLAVGIWILIRPGTFIVLIPIVIGILLVYHGIKDILFTVEVKKIKNTGWWVGLIIAVLAIVLGLLLILHTWLAIKVGTIFVGVVLIYNGISGVCLNRKAAWASKKYHSENDPIDADYKEE